MLQTLQGYYDQFMTQVVNQSWFYPLLATIGVLIVFLLLAGFRRHKGLRVYRDESGNASISKKALRDLVHIACARIDTASKPKIGIRPHRGRLDMTIKMKLYEGQRLNELRDQMRRTVIKTFEEGHGIRLGDIDVLVIGFKRVTKSPSPAPIIEEPTEPETDPAVIKEPEPEPAVESTSSFETSDNTSETISESSEDVAPKELVEEKKPARRSFFTWGAKKEDNSDALEELATDSPEVSEDADKKDDAEGLLGSKKD